MHIAYKKSNKKSSGLHAAVYLILLIGLGAAITAGCRDISGQQPPAASPTPIMTLTATAVFPTQSPKVTTPQPGEELVITTPTLAPTTTPSQLDVVVEKIVEGTGIDKLSLFGMSAEDLVNMLISILIMLLGSILGAVIINGLQWLTKRTSSQIDDRLLKAVEKLVKGLVSLIFLQFATARLVFLSPTLKQWLNLTYFSLFVLVIGAILWKLIDLGLESSLQRASSPQSRDLLVTFTPLLRRMIQVVIILIGVAIVLQNFGVNLSALLAILGLGGLAISLAAKETLEDMISGFIILIDRPFQIGDRIKIETMDDWGDVDSIGARTTRIRTLDNRLVIIPNSVIGRTQVENYTYPDPSYRISLSLGIGYGSDVDQVVKTIKEAIQSTPGIMKSKPPSVEFVEFGNSAMLFTAMYWLNSYKDINQGIRTQVNKSIATALDAVNIEMPFITYDINLANKNISPDTNNG